MAASRRCCRRYVVLMLVLYPGDIDNPSPMPASEFPSLNSTAVHKNSVAATSIRTHSASAANNIPAPYQITPASKRFNELQGSNMDFNVSTQDDSASKTISGQYFALISPANNITGARLLFLSKHFIFLGSFVIDHNIRPLMRPRRQLRIYPELALAVAWLSSAAVVSGKHHPPPHLSMPCPSRS